MALKALLKDLSEAPEAARSFYTKQEDGSYVLDFDDAPLKGKVEEFRTNNRKLNGELETLKQQMEKLKGIDPEEYAKAKEALKHLEGVEDAELIKAGKWEEVIKKRTSTMQTEYEKKLSQREKTLKDALDKLDMTSNRYKALRIQTEVAKVINEIGTPRPGALEDILGRASRVATVGDDDSIVLKDVFDEKGQPADLKAWGQSLLRNAAHLFEPSTGGGASGGRANGTTSGGKKMISRAEAATGRYLEAIAKGEVVVNTD